MDTEVERPKERGRPRKSIKNDSALQNEVKNNKKKQKLYCVCRKPYDNRKLVFYLGCFLDS